MAVATILCPLPGTFYRSPGPGEPPFKAEGDKVSPGETVGLVEVMKTFTPVECDVGGTLIAFHVDHEGAVVAGQPLLDVET